MTRSEIFQALGEDGFRQVTGAISISRLKTYQLYETMKARARVPKLNVQNLRKAAPKLWERLAGGDEALADDLAQAVLVSNLDMVVQVLDFLKIPHTDGFFDKDFDASAILPDDWRQKAYDHFKASYPSALLVFYLNHLAWEVTKAQEMFRPAGDA